MKGGLQHVRQEGVLPHPHNNIYLSRFCAVFVPSFENS